MATAQDMEERYLEEDRRKRSQTSRIGCWLAMTLMPAGAILDLMVYPDHFGSFFVIRLVSTLLVIPIYLLHHTQVGLRHISLLNLGWVLAINAGICAMIAYVDGATSPYYAGLNLVFLAMGLLMPLTWRESLACCSITIAMYFIATTIYSDPFDHPGILFNNLYFLCLTALVCCIASAVSTRRRREDFRLREEIAQRNAELAASNQKLAELDRLRTHFFANVSHELRTPLTLILGPIDDLLSGSHRLPDRTAESLGIARQNGLRLLKLINDLLEIVRLEDGATHIEFRRMDLAPWLAGLVDSVRYLAESKSLVLETQGVPEGIMITADSSRLEKVFINLISNAIKFTPAGGHVTVSWELDGETVRCVVEDSGIGIPDAELPHIFERFRQVDGSSTRAFQGAGLGLALARELVEEHGGSLTVSSQPGRGSRFMVELLRQATVRIAAPPTDRDGPEPGLSLSTIGPSVMGDRTAALHAQAERRGGIPLSPLEEESDAVTGTGDHRILVVDDEPDMRRYLSGGLSEHYEVYQAGTGLAAIDLAVAHRPDAIILDLMLPGIDGLEVCSRLRAIPDLSDTKILLLTARVDETAKLEALRRGADDFLTKPFSFVEVRTRIENLLRTHDLQQQLRHHAHELEQTLDQLRATEGQLVQSEKVRALGDMAAGVLHEIGNPLNFAMAAIDLAREDAPPDADPDLLDSLTDALEGMQRIKAIISDLKAFAYPTEAASATPIPLRQIVDSALRLSGNELKSVAIDCSIPPGLQIMGSKDQLLHVFMNLLVNAAKAVQDRQTKDPAAPPGRIELEAQHQGDMIAVVIRDNGVGIPPETIERIFDPFFTTRDVQEGMGLGLSLCRTIASHHDGKLTVTSQPGHGTEFTLTLHSAVPEIAT